MVIRATNYCRSLKRGDLSFYTARIQARRLTSGTTDDRDQLIVMLESVEVERNYRLAARNIDFFCEMKSKLSKFPGLRATIPIPGRRVRQNFQQRWWLPVGSVRRRTWVSGAECPTAICARQGLGPGITKKSNRASTILLEHVNIN